MAALGRSPATVIVPFLGSAAELEVLARRFGAIERRDGDELIVVDNGPVALPDPGVEGARVLWAGEVASSYYARNAGAAAARGEWLVFCDADTEPMPGLLDAHLDPAPGERVGILAGAVRDHPAGDGIAARLARATGAMRQDASLSDPYMPYAITANCAVRAGAFAEAGGFEEGVRSGGDADLCWRLQRLGWSLEPRPAALVHHRNRSTLRALWRQRLRHGAGAGWLARRYPGAMPRWGLAALARDSALRVASGARRLAGGERGALALELATVSGWWAFELGRRTSNRARPR